MLCVRAHILVIMLQELKVVPSQLSDQQILVEGKQQQTGVTR